MFQHHSRRTQLLRVRGLNDEVMGQDDRAAEVKNFALTEEGTLRTVNGPVLYQAPYLAVGGFASEITGQIEGIFHHRLETGRDILLSYHNGGIYEHQGWRSHGTEWHALYGSPTADWQGSLYSEKERCFLTQFVATPAGVVIIPQGGGNYSRSLFYDGDFVAPLGFSEAPAAPEGHGPKANVKVATGTAANRGKFDDTGSMNGYYVSPLYPLDGLLDNVKGLPAVFGPHRLGTTSPYPTSHTSGVSNPFGGEISEGQWRCKAQWVDRWGNKSALSPESNGVQCSQQENVTQDRINSSKTDASRLKVQALWVLRDAPKGPVLGTNLFRTQDLRSSGDSKFYHILDYATTSRLAVVTMPGREPDVYPDNIPDSWLLREAQDYEPVQNFKVACLALGRLWAGNFDGDPGRIMPSEVGLWGTFPVNNRIYPDTKGEVTALHAVPGGLLAFTESSTFLIENNDSGRGFRVQSISSRVGCVSPNSVATMLNGAVIWLGREGFFGWAPGDLAPTELSTGFRRTVKRINPQWRLRACAAVDQVKGEYRCWAPVDSAKVNTLCFVYNGVDWATRTDVDAEAVCVTNDDRQYMIASGTARQSILDAQGDRAVSDYKGVYVLDHDGDGIYRSDHENREAVIETSWFRSHIAYLKASSYRITLLFKETGKWNCKVEVFRDYRERAIQTSLITDDQAPALYASADPPPFWGEVELNGESFHEVLKTEANPSGRQTNRWEARRPFWQKYDIFVPHCETFKIRLTFTGDAEFVGIRYGEQTSGADIGEAEMEGGVR